MFRVSNVVRVADVLESHSIPDVSAEAMLAKEVVFSDGTTSATLAASSPENHTEVMEFNPDSFPRFSMCLGDFVDIYSGDDNKDFWDAITTCFFVDTAPVVGTYSSKNGHEQ